MASGQERPSYSLGISEDLRQEYSVIDMTLFALTNILRNEHLQKNFAPHFLPIDDYAYEFPKEIPQPTLMEIKTVFTDENLPQVIFKNDSELSMIPHCSIYGYYNGRRIQEDEDKIYLNKEILNCSKLFDDIEHKIKYASMLLFSIIHELGHWSFFKFACKSNDEKSTPCGILMEESGDAIECLIFGFRLQHYGAIQPKFQIDDIVTKTNNMRRYRIVPDDYLKSLFQPETYQNVENMSSLRIPNQVLLSSLVLDEELNKFHGKRVFDPNDDCQLASPQSSSNKNDQTKRIFEPCDKLFPSRNKK